MSQSQQGFWGLVCLPVGFLHRIHRNSHIPMWRVLLCAQLWKQKNFWALHQPLGLHQGLLCFLANKELRDLHILFPAQLLGLVCAGRIHPAINPCSSSVSKQASEAAEIKLKFVFSALLGFFFWYKRKNFTCSDLPFPAISWWNYSWFAYQESCSGCNALFFFLNYRMWAVPLSWPQARGQEQDPDLWTLRLLIFLKNCRSSQAPFCSICYFNKLSS